MDNVARQNVAELSHHINLYGLILALRNLFDPIGEGINSFYLKCLEHMLKTIFVKSV